MLGPLIERRTSFWKILGFPNFFFRRTYHLTGRACRDVYVLALVSFVRVVLAVGTSGAHPLSNRVAVAPSVSNRGNCRSRCSGANTRGHLVTSSAAERAVSHPSRAVVAYGRIRLEANCKSRKEVRRLALHHRQFRTGVQFSFGHLLQIFQS